MEQTGIGILDEILKNKLVFFKHKGRYFVYALLAGCYIAIGIAFSYSVGGALYASEALSGAYKIALGVTFALAFILIIFAGAELFTGNVLYMSVGLLSGRTRLREALALLGFSFAANILGIALFCGLYASTKLPATTSALILETVSAKLGLSFAQAFSRGIFCNILVCLAVWMGAKLKSPTAKMLLYTWVMAGFVTPGFEHCIANAGLYTLAALLTDVPLSAVLLNMLYVTLGNLAGGAFIGAAYYFVAGKPRPLEGSASASLVNSTEKDINA